MNDTQKKYFEAMKEFDISLVGYDTFTSSWTYEGHVFKVRLVNGDEFNEDGLQLEKPYAEPYATHSRRRVCDDDEDNDDEMKKYRAENQIPSAEWFVDEVHVATNYHDMSAEEDVLHDISNKSPLFRILYEFLDVIMYSSGNDDLPFMCAHYNT